jgi:hypothetical protein
MATRVINFTDIGVNDQIPYTKIDLLKVARVNNNFAMSFYQLDYQAVATSLSGVSKVSPETIKPMPVAKIVMDYPVFQQLLKELNGLNEIFKKEMETETKG